MHCRLIWKILRDHYGTVEGINSLKSNTFTSCSCILGTRVAPDTDLAGHPAWYPVRPDIRYPAKYSLKDNRVYCWLDFGGYFVMFFMPWVSILLPMVDTRWKSLLPGCLQYLVNGWEFWIFSSICFSRVDLAHIFGFMLCLPISPIRGRKTVFAGLFTKVIKYHIALQEGSSFFLGTPLYILFSVHPQTLYF